MTENRTEKGAGFKTIEEYAQESGVAPAVLEGIKASRGWKNGRQVDGDEFTEAWEGFLNAPVDGRTAKKEAKG